MYGGAGFPQGSYVNKVSRCLIVSGLALLISEPSVAQNIGSIPGAIQNTAIETAEFYQRQQRLNKQRDEQERFDETLVESGQSHRAPENSNSDQLISVSGIIVDASAILSAEEVEAVTKKYEHQDLLMSDLSKMLDEINALYRQHQVITARALLPPQKVQGGVIRVQLVEARLDEVIFRNRQSTRAQYIAKRIDATPGELADVHRLEQDLLVFNGVNDVKLRAILQPGSKPETTSYLIDVYEPKNIVATVFADNTGRDSIGKERLGLNFINLSLTGNRDRLTLGGSYAEGTDAAYMAYNVPLNTQGTRMIVGYNYSKIAIISSDLETFNITGRSTIGSLHVSHPIRITGQSSVFGVLGINVKESETVFDKVDRFKSSVRSYSLAGEFQGLSQAYQWYASPQLNVGIDRFGGDESFTLINGELGGVLNLADKHEVRLRFRGQLSDTDLLPSSEQFQLGGAASVRGYPEGFLIGDQGYFSSVEYRFSMIDFNGSKGSNSRLDSIVFVDHGGIYTSASGEALDREDYLTSVGIGFLYRYADKLQINVLVGFPLDDKSNLDDDYAVHFVVGVTPF